MFSKGVGKAVGEGVVTIIGWGFGLGILGGAWTVGWWIASALGDVGADRTAFGLLSALAFLWIYERREAHERYDRLCERLDHRGSSL